MYTRKLAICTLVLCSAFASVYGQSDNGVNYLDYFAADNSLDNQPLIGTENHLRFFPVFSMKDKIESAQMRVYRNYDPIPYCRDMDRMNDGIYWEGLLPAFRLGQGIHRIEVEIKIALDSSYSERLERLKEEQAAAEKIRDSVKKNISDFLSTAHAGSATLDSALEKLRNNVVEHRKAINENIVNSELERLQRASSSLEAQVQAMDSEFQQLQQSLSDEANAECQILLNEIKKIAEEIRRLQRIETAGIQAFELPLDQTKKFQEEANTLLDRMHAAILSYQEILRSLDPQLLSKADKYTYAVKQIENLKEEIASNIYESIIATLSDRSYSGPGIGKSDIIIDSDFKSARILYRNYNIGMRQNPALDPAEKLGIFRVRYVPFAVIGGELITAVSADNANRKAVFEVGMGFGDVTIASDQLFKPALSSRRLGVVFAISEELFSDNATIRALALTYEFNAYGSISAGANFPIKGKAQSYFSFGINKKAFEALLGQIQKIL